MACTRVALFPVAADDLPARVELVERAAEGIEQIFARVASAVACDVGLPLHVGVEAEAEIGPACPWLVFDPRWAHAGGGARLADRRGETGVEDGGPRCAVQAR